MLSSYVLGILVCIVFAFIATFLGGLQHVIGAPMIGLFLGAIAGNIKPATGEYKKGTTFAAKKFLMLGIILAGATLDFNLVIEAGSTALPLIIINLCASFGTAFLVGKFLGVTLNVKRLVGSGTAICGGTAIATVSPIIDANEEEMAYALTAIFLFDIIAALGFPFLSQLINLTADQFGVLAGTAISDTSSVVAAGDTFAQMTGLSQAADLAVIVKLTRTTFLVLVSLIFTFVSVNEKRKNSIINSELATSPESFSQQQVERQSIGKVIIKVFPWFILGFLCMAIFNTMGVFPKSTESFFKNGYKFLVTAALVGVGYKINIKDLFTKGIKPIILGGFTWISVATISMIYVLFIM